MAAVSAWIGWIMYGQGRQLRTNIVLNICVCVCVCVDIFCRAEITCTRLAGRTTMKSALCRCTHQGRQSRRPQKTSYINIMLFKIEISLCHLVCLTGRCTVCCRCRRVNIFQGVSGRVVQCSWDRLIIGAGGSVLPECQKLKMVG